MKKFNVAVIGATGAVGESIFEILEQRDFPIENLYPLASSRSIDKTIMYKQHNFQVEDIANFDFALADIALFSAGSEVSAKYAPIASSKGCVVIDNTSCFRYEDDIPLVVPEVNPEDIEGYSSRNIIANPNCSTIQMLVALAPLHRKWKLKEIVVSTYQSVSGAGKSAVSQLVSQTHKLLSGSPVDADDFPRQIAFNVIPQIDVWQDNGYSKEEMKMVWETRKILKDNNVIVNPTTVRVPTCYGHAESIHIKFAVNVNVNNIVDELKAAQGLEVFDEQEDYPTPFEHGSGTDLVAVGRIRQAIDLNNGINMWVVADNVRKGAALNSVQIAEILANKYL